jgi:NodT family efflux transporter outer membrane factor (OMF) lipoprotein
VEIARALVGVVALAVAGCASPGQPPVALRAPNDTWESALQPNGLTREAMMRWWEGFNDQELDERIEEALRGNPDLRVAAERVRESRANATAADSVLWPTINATGSVARNKDRSRIPAKPPILNIGQLGLSSGWELDLFGGNQAAAESAGHAALANRELERAARVALAAEVASTLFTQRNLVAQLETQKASVAVSREVWRFAFERYRRGLATQFDVDRAWSLTKTLEAQIPQFEGEIKILSHRLAVLAGRLPSGEPASAVPLPEDLPAVPAVIPSEWLEARPDLRAARQRVEAANASLSRSKAAFFPTFAFSAGVARDRLEFQGLPAFSGNVFALGLGMVQPIFNAGRVRAQEEGADARLRQAVANYDSALLEAVEEVENAFAAYASSAARRQDLEAARSAALRARDAARALYERGLVDYGVYLDAQRVHLAAGQSLTDMTARRAIALVALYRAFGGGIATENDRISEAGTNASPNRPRLMEGTGHVQ